jgi:ankyrin repeat protein
MRRLNSDSDFQRVHAGNVSELEGLERASGFLTSSSFAVAVFSLSTAPPSINTAISQLRLHTLATTIKFDLAGLACPSLSICFAVFSRSLALRRLTPNFASLLTGSTKPADQLCLAALYEDPHPHPSEPSLSKLIRQLDVNTVNGYGWTAAIVAASNETTTNLKMLAFAGADLDVVDRGGRTAAHVAAENENDRMMACLIEAGAKVDEPTARFETTPAFFAAENRNPRVLELLIRAGADVQRERGSSVTPMHAAAKNANGSVLSVALALLGNRYDASRLLVSAAQSFGHGAMEAILAHHRQLGAPQLDPARVVDAAHSAASWNPNHLVTRSLLQHDAALLINSKSSDYARSLVSSAALNRNEAVLAAVIEAGAKIDSAAFFAAVKNRNDRVLSMLIDAGAELPDPVQLVPAAADNSNEKVLATVLALTKGDARVATVTDSFGRSLRDIAAQNLNPRVRAIVDAIGN